MSAASLSNYSEISKPSVKTLAWLTILLCCYVLVLGILGDLYYNFILYSASSVLDLDSTKIDGPIGVSRLRRDFPWYPQDPPWLITFFVGIGGLIASSNVLAGRRRLWPLILMSVAVAIYVVLPVFLLTQRELFTRWDRQPWANHKDIFSILITLLVVTLTLISLHQRRVSGATGGLPSNTTSGPRANVN